MFKEKKLRIGCIAMAIIMSILIVNYVVIYMQNYELKKEAIDNTKAEWYQLYHLSEIVDKYYINNNFQDPQRFRMYINKICYHFAAVERKNELSKNMGYLLEGAYDPLFADFTMDKGPLNKEKATELLKGMNKELMLISKGIIDMQDKEIEEILGPTTSKYNEVNKHVKDVTDKYIQAVEDYFEKYK